MYNGNDGNKQTSNRSYTGRSYTAGSNYITIGGFRIKPIYFYIGIAAIFILVLAFLIRVLDTSLSMHFSMIAGALLLLANLRELIGHTYTQHSSTALLNCLIGGSLIFAWLGGLFWLPAVVLLAVALPLVIGRSTVYVTYVQVARNLVGGLFRTMGRS